MLSITNMERSYDNNSGNVDNRRSRFVMPGLLVEVETETCRAGPDEEGGIRHVLDLLGTGLLISSMSSMVEWRGKSTSGV